MSKKKTIIISIIILLISAAITLIVFLTEPKAQREAAVKKTAMLVEVIKVNKGNYKPTVVATGTVQAAKDITLSPQVEGAIVSISENFIPGSFVKKGEVLLQIDPSDFRNILKLRRSDLQLAKANLSIEMGRQDVARKDYELIGQDLSEDNKALVLREPQLESAKANVDAAQASVDQAQLNLNRTIIRAPFDAHIISRNVNVGTQVAQGADLGRIVGMDEYWVVANIPTDKVICLSFAEESDKGSEVKIINNGWPEDLYREGILSRLVGALDPQTRMARVLITVQDPLARKTGNDSVPPLMIGTFVETYIQAQEIKDVVRLNRDFLRKDETVWVMHDNKLSIRDVDIIFQDANYAYIREGLSDDEMVVTTDLSTVVEGSPLRTESSQPIKKKEQEREE